MKLKKVNYEESAEYWTANNNCKRCEHDCKYFDGFCRLLENLKPCYLITDCYYKQNKMLDNSLKKISKSIETIIRVDKLTKEMDNALTQEILHIKNICDEAMKNYLDLYSL